jgi:uncharacterized damage-inducible protein DinB
MKIKDFKPDWNFVRGKTFEFLNSVPNEKWTWRPNDELGTFGMQVRHMIVSQEAYISGLQSGKVDFSKKDFDSEWENDKEKALAKLKKIDEELFKILETINENKEILFVDGIIGEKKIPASTVLDYMLQHEIYHQGIFTTYGRLAGFGKFRFM